MTATVIVLIVAMLAALLDAITTPTARPRRDTSPPRRRCRFRPSPPASVRRRLQVHG